MKLRDVDAEQLATEVHDALESLCRSIGFELGLAIVGGGGPSHVRLSVHQLTTFAKTGAPPEGRAELTAEYMLSVALLLDHLSGDAHAALRARLELVLAAARGREAIAAGHDLHHDALAALADLERTRLWQLRKRGDAPEGRPDPNNRRHVVYDPDASRTWLSGRGVAGL